MSATLMIDPRQFTATGGDNGTIQPGFTAENLESPRIVRSWRGDAGIGQTLIFDTGSIAPVGTVLVQSMQNVPFLTVLHSTNGSSYTPLGNMTAYSDGANRARGKFYVGLSTQYIRFDISATGGPDYNVGAVYIFSEDIQLPRSARFGVSQEYVRPAQTTILPNGRLARVNLGRAYSVFRMQFDEAWRELGENMMIVFDELRRGTCGLSMDYHDWDFWPVILEDPSANVSWANAGVDRISLNIREIV